MNNVVCSNKQKRLNPFKVALGKRITKIRIDNDLTVEAFAEDLEVSVNAVSKWQRGLCSPDIENLAIMASRYDVSLDYLITGKERGDDEMSSPLPICA